MATTATTNLEALVVTYRRDCRAVYQAQQAIRHAEEFLDVAVERRGDSEADLGLALLIDGPITVDGRRYEGQQSQPGLYTVAVSPVDAAPLLNDEGKPIAYFLDSPEPLAAAFAVDGETCEWDQCPMPMCVDHRADLERQGRLPDDGDLEGASQ